MKNPGARDDPVSTFYEYSQEVRLPEIEVLPNNDAVLDVCDFLTSFRATSTAPRR